jgi:hypothetical protein
MSGIGRRDPARLSLGALLASSGGRIVVAVRPMSRRTSRRLSRFARIGLTAGVLFGLCAGTVGFPVAPPGAIGGAFPCQGHGCGCRSAEECWFGCCCLSPGERVAWAKRNGVTPPAELVELAELEEAPPEKPSCCSGHAACCHKHEAGGKSCCSKAAAKKSSPDEDPFPAVVPLRCRGLGQWWVAGGEPLALPERPARLIPSPLVAPVVIASVEYAHDLVPPPTRPG